MKKHFLLLPLLGLLSVSCSDKLTESKVEKLINECWEKEPNVVTKSLYVGELSRFSYNQNKAEYQELVKQGLVKIDSTKEDYGNYYNYTISFTDKAKPYVISIDEEEKAEIKLYTYKLDKVETIQETPAFKNNFF